MIVLQKLNPRRYDVYVSVTGKCVGDFTQSPEGKFLWFHNMPSGVPVESSVIRAIADSIDQLNQQINGKVQELYESGSAPPPEPKTAYQYPS